MSISDFGFIGAGTECEVDSLAVHEIADFGLEGHSSCWLLKLR